MNLKTKIEPISAKLESSLKNVSFIYANSLFRENVREYQSNLIRFDRLLSDIEPSSVADKVEIARRLCQLSREIIFSVDGRQLPDEMKHSLSKLYSLTVELMDHLSQDDSIEQEVAEELRAYRNNVNKRASGNDPWCSLEKVLASDNGGFDFESSH